MRTCTIVLAAALAAGAGAREKPSKADVEKQLLGRWETTSKTATGQDFPIVVEFKAGGKLAVTAQKLTFAGTYAVHDDGTLETETEFDGKKTKVKQEVKFGMDTLELKDVDGPTTKFKRLK